MTPEERLAAAAWAATQEIAGSSAHRARLDEAVAVMAPAEAWNELKQAWRERAVPKGLKHVWMGGSEAMSPRTCAVCLQREDNMMQTMQDTPCPGQSVAPWGAGADRRVAEEDVPTLGPPGAKCGKTIRVMIPADSIKTTIFLPEARDSKLPDARTWSIYCDRLADEADHTSWEAMQAVIDHEGKRQRDIHRRLTAEEATTDLPTTEPTLTLTGAKFQGPDLPVAVALASHRRAVMAAEADPFFGCTAGAPDWGQDGAAGRPVVSGFRAGDYERTDAPPTSGGWTNQFDGKELFDRLNAQAADRGGVVNMTIEEWRREFGKRTPVVLLAEQCEILPERQAQQSDAFFNRQIDEHGDARRLREENARLRAELRTMRAVINAVLGE